MRVIIIGGSSGIGLGTAKDLISSGHEVIIASRSREKLEEAQRFLSYKAEVYELDGSDEVQVKEFFQNVNSFDHLIVTSGIVNKGSIQTLESDKILETFQSKLFSLMYAVKHALPRISSTGSIIAFSGIYSDTPIKGSSVMSSVNSAVESFVQAAALDISPVRINVVSPGVIDTPARQFSSDFHREAFFEKVSARQLISRVGDVTDVVQTIRFLMDNSFMTGSVIKVDGGMSLVTEM